MTIQLSLKERYLLNGIPEAPGSAAPVQTPGMSLSDDKARTEA